MGRRVGRGKTVRLPPVAFDAPPERGAADAENGGGLYFIRIKDTLQEQLAESGALKVIGGGNTFDSKTEAIAEIFLRLDAEICRTCTARIFRECGARPASV